jgi:hypothetical protein
MTECLFDDPEDFDEDGDETHEMKFVTCSRCGEEDLYWALRDQSWVLMNENGERHDCALTLDGFERID